MVQLETVEDFEKVRKALDDPNSKPEQYAIRSFGYCSFCEELTEYRGWGMFGNAWVDCLQCLKSFEHPSFGSEHLYYSFSSKHNYYYTTGKNIPLVKEDQIPKELRLEFNKLNSLEYQRKIFNEKREDLIKKLKQQTRTANSQVRRLAKLRTEKFSTGQTKRLALDNFS